MADLSKLKLPDNSEYDLKDATARSGLANKQDTLVSGTNIKTINNESLLGSGNITIQGGGDSLPSQTNHSGDVLSTDGSNPYWMDTESVSAVDVITSIDSSSTDNMIPSAKAVYDAIDSIPTDDHKWAGVELGASGANIAIDSYVPSKDSMGNTSGTASWARVTSTPQNYCIAKYDGDKYLYSTTPSANDSTTKVATTGFVQTAISNIDALPAQSSSTNGKVLTSVYNSQTSVASASWADLPEEIYFCRSNTTLTEAATAVNTGKMLIYYDSTKDVYAPMIRAWTQMIQFTAIEPNDPHKLYIFTLNSSGWSTETVDTGETFLAEFNVTTFDEIKEAYDANKYIYLKYTTLKKTGSSEDIQWSICPLAQFYYEELDGTDYKGQAYFLMPLNTEPTPDPYLSYKYAWIEINTLNDTELWGTSTSSFSFAKSNHAHGNITNGGDITATAPTITNGDQIIINDDSASKITNGPTFDGSTTNKYLSPKGTWETIRPIEAVTYPTFDNINNTYNHKVIEVTSGTHPKLYISHGSFSVNDEFWIISYIDSLIDVAGSNADIYINGNNGDPGIQLTKKYQVAYFKLVSIANDSYNTEYWIATLTSADAIPTPSTTAPSMDGTASYGSGTSYARSNHVHPTDTSRAPTSHASSATTYGTGTSSNYGHVKLSDSTSSTSSTSGGIAATPSAVKSAYDLANGAIPKPSSPSNGNVLTYNGSSWIASSIPEEVFVATFDTTSFSSISSALSAGKIVFVMDDIGNIFGEGETNIIYAPLTFDDQTYTSYTFSCFINDETLVSYSVDSSSVWDRTYRQVSELFHSHGLITTDGKLQTTDIDIASGDKLVVTDSSNSNKVARTSLSFDGTTETKYLSKKGTWVDVPSSGSADIYWCTYGTTSSSDIETAYQAGKICAIAVPSGGISVSIDGTTTTVASEGEVYILTFRKSSTEHRFVSAIPWTSNQALTFTSLWCNNDVWSVDFYDKNQEQAFWCTYGTTTSAEIEAAFQAKKEICCFYNNRVYYLTYRSSSTSHTFSSIATRTHYVLTCNSDSWSNTSYAAAPSSHASTTTTYGSGTSTSYGHVKLYDTGDSSLDTSGGTAATPKAITSWTNRTVNVSTADTNYTTLMTRGEKLLDSTTFDGVSDWSSQLVNGAVAWRYE